MGLRTASGPPPKNYRLYRKHGNAETALEDFQSVVPRIVNAKPKNEKPQYTFGKARRVGFVTVTTPPGGGLAQWLSSRTTDPGIPGLRPGQVAVRCLPPA